MIEKTIFLRIMRQIKLWVGNQGDLYILMLLVDDASASSLDVHVGIMIPAEHFG